MLNPEFRLLDPESEQMGRLASLSGFDNTPVLPGNYALMTLEPGIRAEFFLSLTTLLATPGDHPLAEINYHIRELAEKMQIKLVEPKIFGFPEAFITRFIGHLNSPCVLMLGILDQAEIWAGGIAGVSKGGLDFFTTFQFLWSNEPELAAKQSVDDFVVIADAVSQNFSRPVGGLFIYRDNFMQLSQTGWSEHYLAQCKQEGKANYQFPDLK